MNAGRRLGSQGRQVAQMALGPSPDAADPVPACRHDRGEGSDANGATSERPYPLSGAERGAAEGSDEKNRPRACGLGCSPGYRDTRRGGACGGGPARSPQGASRVDYCSPLRTNNNLLRVNDGGDILENTRDDRSVWTNPRSSRGSKDDGSSCR